MRKNKKYQAAALRALMAVTAVVVFALMTLAGRTPKAAGTPRVVRGTPINAAATPAEPFRPPAAAAQSAAPAITQPGEAAGDAAKSDYPEIGFDKLSDFSTRWVCETTNAITLQWIPRLVNPIPENITALNGKNVAVRGFMVPMKVREGLVTEFVLARNQMMCCYGKPLQINEWLYVRMEGKGIKALMDKPITVCGTLGMGAFLEEGAVGLYRLEGRKVELPGGS